MPAFRIEKAGAVENENSQHGDDPQPIDIVASFSHVLVSCDISIFHGFFPHLGIGSLLARRPPSASSVTRESNHHQSYLCILG